MSWREPACHVTCKASVILLLWLRAIFNILHLHVDVMTFKLFDVNICEHYDFSTLGLSSDKTVYLLCLSLLLHGYIYVYGPIL